MTAPRARVYNALTDASAIAKWKVPTGMTSHVHAFEGHEGGSFQISLTYDDPTYAVLVLIGREGAGAHDVVRMARQGRVYVSAAESHYTPSRSGSPSWDI